MKYNKLLTCLNHKYSFINTRLVFDIKSSENLKGPETAKSGRMEVSGKDAVEKNKEDAAAAIARGEKAFGLGNIDVENPPPERDYPDTDEGRKQKEKDDKYYEEYDKRVETAKKCSALLNKVEGAISKIKSKEENQPPLNKKLLFYAEKNKITKRGNQGEAYITDSLDGSAPTRPRKFTNMNLANIKKTLKEWANSNKQVSKGDLGIAIMRMAKTREFNQWSKQLEGLNNECKNVGV